MLKLIYLVCLQNWWRCQLSFLQLFQQIIDIKAKNITSLRGQNIGRVFAKVFSQCILYRIDTLFVIINFRLHISQLKQFNCYCISFSYTFYVHGDTWNFLEILTQVRYKMPPAIATYFQSILKSFANPFQPSIFW